MCIYFAPRLICYRHEVVNVISVIRWFDVNYKIYFNFFFYFILYMNRCRNGFRVPSYEYMCVVFVDQGRLNELMSQIRMQNHFGAVRSEERYNVDVDVLREIKQVCVCLCFIDFRSPSLVRAGHVARDEPRTFGFKISLLPNVTRTMECLLPFHSCSILLNIDSNTTLNS